VLEQVVEEARPTASEGQIKLELSSVDACWVGCDESILANLVANLVGNALKYMGTAPVREVSVRAVSFSHRIRIEVQDTGPGISTDAQKNIFRPYIRATSAAVPGLGLGLATVQRLTQALGGEVGVSSRQGSGSLFWVELPLGQAPENLAIAEASVRAATASASAAP
jgi:signal transduction histidine kinase